MKTWTSLLFVACMLLQSSFAHKHSCGTHSQGEKVLDSVETRIGTLKKKRTAIACKGCITIDTYVHVFHGSNGDGTQVDSVAIARQMQILNDGFSQTPFQFRLVDAQFIVDDTFYKSFFTTPAEVRDEDPVTLANRYRKGDYKTLNMYFGGLEVPFSFATFPESGGLSGNPLDGVYNGIDTTDNWDGDDSTLGTTAIHEVGHWLGLEHTFNSVTGKRCDPNDKNDYVLDTPQQADFESGTDGCPTAAIDTCSRLPGKDPVHNYMDYSSDICVDEFTRGQSERMFYVWSVYRALSESCSAGNTKFEFETLTDSWPSEVTWSLASTDGKFLWDTASTESGIDYTFEINTVNTQNLCIDSTKDYVFTISDSEGDGIDSPGYYTIKYNGVTLKTNSAFGRSEVTSFSGGGIPATTAPVPVTSAPIAPTTSAPVVATQVPATSAPVTSAPATSAPATPAPTDAPEGFFGCFSGASTVHVQDVGVVSMDQLQIGDMVLTKGNKYEPVYSFGHHKIDRRAEFLRIFSAGTDKPTEVSREHLLLSVGPTGNKGVWIPAEMLKVGDLLFKGGDSGSLVAITKIRTATLQGVFAPFTKSGTVVVNGIVASSYIGYQQSEYLMIGEWTTPFSFQWLAHTFESGHRLACNYAVDCQKEAYTDDGVSHWVDIPHQATRWLLQQHAVTMVAYLVPSFCIFLLTSGLEYLSSSWVYATAALVLCFLRVHTQRRSDGKKSLC